MLPVVLVVVVVVVIVVVVVAVAVVVAAEVPVSGGKVWLVALLDARHPHMTGHSARVVGTEHQEGVKISPQTPSSSTAPFAQATVEFAAVFDTFIVAVTVVAAAVGLFAMEVVTSSAMHVDLS